MNLSENMTQNINNSSNMSKNSSTSIEELEQRTRSYLDTVTEPDFVAYLQKMLGRIQAQKNQVHLLNEELDRSYQMYLNRVKPKQEETVEKLQEPIPQNHEQEQSKYFDIGDSPKAQTINAQPKDAGSARRLQSSNEFFIGTVILSVIGGGFILAALVMLGMYYMSGFVKGMCLYAGTLAVLLVSELVLYRRWPKLGMTFTAISIGGLYLVTVLNYLTFGNFNMWVALGVSLAITILVILLSWKRDSVLYRALGLITCLLCFLIIQEGNTFTELMVMAAITLFINIMCIAVPIKRNITIFRILHMYVNGIFAFIVAVRLGGFADVEISGLIFAVCAMFVALLLLVLQVYYQRREAEAGRTIGKIGIVVGYFLANLLIYTSLPESVKVLTAGSEVLHFGGFGAILVIAVLGMLLLRKGNEMWYPYFWTNLVAIYMFCVKGGEWEVAIGIAVLLVVSKLLSLSKASWLQMSDAVLTTLCCILCLCYAQAPMGCAVILVLAVLISIPFIRYWQTYYEVILVFTLGFFAVVKLPALLELPAFVGIMFVGILLFNNVKAFQGKHIVIFNGLALAAQIVCFLLLINPIYRNAYIVYLCMLVFGLATIVLTFQEKYHMDFRYKNLILAVFLTYMALIVRTNLPVINSILMMLIALVCVGWGFAIKEKPIRIYGLVLSFLVCGKMVIYDFFDMETLQKTILLFSVGVIALIISGIYIVLERKINVPQVSSGEEQ